MKNIWLVGSVLLLAAGRLSFAGPVELKEKYHADQSDGDFTPGKIGQALGVWTGEPLVYPVLFNRREVTEGTVSFWFRPARRYPREYDIQSFFGLTDGAVTIAFTLNGEGRPFPERRLIVPGAHVEMGESLSRSFQHLLYTWKGRTAQLYLNGRPLSAVPGANGTVQGVGPMNGRSAVLKLSAGHVIWFDEIVVLDRYVQPEEALVFYQANGPRPVDTNTAFYAAFEGRLSGTGFLRNDGDVVRLVPQVGRTDATFRADDRPEFLFPVLNSTGAARQLVLKGTVKDLEKKTVLEKSVPVKAEPGRETLARFDWRGLRRNGLFWGYFTLEEDGREIQAENIPFARTLLSGTNRELTTGLVVGQGIPRDFENWTLLYSEYWYQQEPEAGRLYLERLDFKVNNLVRTGRHPVVMLCYPPEWYCQKYKNSATLEGYYYPDADEPEAMEKWKAYVRALGERYKGKVFDYEVYGEAYFRSNGQQYGKLVSITAGVLHAIDPKIRVACNLGGGDNWARPVAQITAGKADYYTIHPYAWVNGAAVSLTDETKYQSNFISLLKECKAVPRLANTEYAAFTLMGLSVHPDGYPMTAREFDASGRWETAPPSLKARGKDVFVDWYTDAFRVVRGVTLNKALGCLYEMWWTAAGGGAIAGLKFREYTPSPASVAYANAAGLFSGYEFVQRMDLGGSSLLKGYLFRKGGDYMLVAFTDDDNPDRTAVTYLKLPGGRAQVLDLYGNPVPVTFAGEIVRLDFRANQPLYIRGITEIPSVSKPVVAAGSVQSKLFPGQKGGVRAVLYNPLSGPVSGVVTVQPPAAFPPVPPQNVSLASGEEKTLLFEVSIPSAAAGDQPMETRFATDSPVLKTVVHFGTLPVRISGPAGQASPAPVVDGNLEEWGDPRFFPISLDRPDQVVVGTPYTKAYIPRIDWKGPADLSARAAVKYDKDNLYIAVRVYDDTVWNDSVLVPGKAYDGDSIEIFLDGSAAAAQGKDSFTDDVFEVVFTPPTGDFPAPCCYQVKPALRKVPRRVLAGLAFASAVGKDGYTLEVRIPWANLKFRPGDMPTGNSLGLDLVVNDQDERNEYRTGRKSSLRWSGQTEAEANPGSFGRILFGGQLPMGDK